MSDTQLNIQWLIDALDREIAHYRKRVGQIFFFSFMLEVLILGGKESILLGSVDGLIKLAIYISLFLAIPFISYIFGREYLGRINVLKDNRTKLLMDVNITKVYPSPKNGESLNEIKMLATVLLSLSLAGVIIFVFNYLNPLPEKCLGKTLIINEMHNKKNALGKNKAPVVPPSALFSR